MTTEQDLLDAIASDYNARFPQSGEYTIITFAEEMKKRNIEMNHEVARDTLNGFVKKGGWTVRLGNNKDGKVCRIYKPIVV